ncbi:MAG: hypothetical protein ACWA40_06915 [Planktomarina sp.]
MIRDGLKMLLAALVVSWRLGPKVLVASWLPLMLFFFFEIAQAHSNKVIASLNPTYHVTIVGGMVTQFWLLAALAVRLHRAALMPQGSAYGTGLGRTQWTYIGHWLLLGIVVCGPFLVASVIGYSEFRHYVPTLYLAFGIGILWLLMCVVFYRASMGLPYLACGYGNISWRQSWRMTRPLTGAIVVATAAGIGGLIVLDALVTPLFYERLSLFEYEYRLLRDALISLTFEVSTILIGASLMNVIYQSCDTPLND